jgi:hypothetical protein
MPQTTRGSCKACRTPVLCTGIRKKWSIHCFETASSALAVRLFGFSRPVFYQALAVLEAAGLPGLIPKRPGPRTAHKLSTDVLDYLDELLSHDPTLRSDDLAQQVLKKFQCSVHARSIERALSRRKKGR